MNDEQRRIALAAANAVQVYLLQPHAQLRQSIDLRCKLLPRLMAALEGTPQRVRVREIREKVVGPAYPGKTHELRALVLALVQELETEYIPDQTLDWSKHATYERDERDDGGSDG